MGFSAILILLCHFISYVTVPSALNYILSIGNVGVDVFLFLSGMGLWFSLDSLYNSNGSIIIWYKKRILKIIISYTIVIIPFTLWRILGQDWSLFDALLFFSTVMYWFNHNGVWFIAMIIPLYIISPVLYQFLRRNRIIKTVVFIILCYALSYNIFDYSTEGLSFIYNVKFVVLRIPAFIVGMCTGIYVKEGKKIKPYYTAILVLMASALMLILTKHLVFTYLFLTVFILVFVAKFIDKIQICTKVLRFMGIISLESYLLNITLPWYFICLFKKANIPDYNNVGMYLIVVFIGISIGFAINKLSNNILGLIQNR